MGSEEEKQAIRDKEKNKNQQLTELLGATYQQRIPRKSRVRRLASIPEDEISDSTYVKDDLATIQWVTKLAREAGSGKGYVYWQTPTMEFFNLIK